MEENKRASTSPCYEREKETSVWKHKVQPTSREELKEFPYNGSFVLMGKMSEKRGGEGRIRIRQNGRKGEGGKALVVNERPTRNRVYISQGFRKGWL